MAMDWVARHHMPVQFVNLVDDRIESVNAHSTWEVGHVPFLRAALTDLFTSTVSGGRLGAGLPTARWADGAPPNVLVIIADGLDSLDTWHQSRAAGA